MISSCFCFVVVSALTRWSLISLFEERIHFLENARNLCMITTESVNDPTNTLKTFLGNEASSRRHSSAIYSWNLWLSKMTPWNLLPKATLNCMLPDRANIFWERSAGLAEDDAWEMEFTSDATSSSLMNWNDCTLFMLNSSITRLLHLSPMITKRLKRNIQTVVGKLPDAS